MADDVQTWEVWYPSAAATGLLVARSRIDPADAVWAHALPRVVAVTVRRGEMVEARGEPLERRGDYLPMTRLRIERRGATRGPLADRRRSRHGRHPARRRGRHPHGVVERRGRLGVALVAGVQQQPLSAATRSPRAPG